MQQDRHLIRVRRIAFLARVSVMYCIRQLAPSAHKLPGLGLHAGFKRPIGRIETKSVPHSAADLALILPYRGAASAAKCCFRPTMAANGPFALI